MYQRKIQNEDFSFEKKPVSKCAIIIIVLLDVFALLVWVIFVNYNFQNPTKMLLENIADVVTALATFSLAAFSVPIVRTVVSEIVPFYVNKIGPREIYKILNKFNYKYDRQYVANEVKKLQLSDPKNEFDSLYYAAVYRLQNEHDEDFNMVWNDFNYYQPSENKNDSIHKYLEDIRYYIYSRVIDNYRQHNAT